MTHCRQQIRDAAVALILANGVVGQCSAGRIRPHDRFDGLRINVYTDTEQVREKSPAAFQERVLDLYIEILTRSDRNYLDDLDGAAVQVETIFQHGVLPGGNRVDLIRSFVDRGDRDDTRHLAAMTLVFGVTYFTMKNDPENFA